MSKSINYDIKFALFEKGIKQNRIADFMGISEYTLSRWLRKEIPEDKKTTILAAIKELAAERGL